MQIKQALLNHCNAYVAQQIKRLNQQIVMVQQALTTQTKSSAGDKHETGRAMAQLEREKLGQQLVIAEKTQQVLQKITLTKSPKVIGVGSLVNTTKANYFIAIAAGKAVVNGQIVFCISAASPIGQLLLGKKVEETVSFNSKIQTITKIV